jgi:hypothetical protein
MSFALWSVLQPRITRYKEDSPATGSNGQAGSNRSVAEGDCPGGERRELEAAAAGASLLMAR